MNTPRTSDLQPIMERLLAIEQAVHLIDGDASERYADLSERLDTMERVRDYDHRGYEAHLETMVAAVVRIERRLGERERVEDGHEVSAAWKRAGLIGQGWTEERGAGFRAGYAAGIREGRGEIGS